MRKNVSFVSCSSVDRICNQTLVVLVLTDRQEAIRRLGQFVAVRHPHLKFVRHSIEELGLNPFVDLDNRLSVLVLQTFLNFSPEDMGQFLHTVANSKDRKVSFSNELPNSFRDVWSTFIIDTGWAAAQDHGNQLVLSKFLGRDLARIQFTIDVQFTNTTSNQVGILGSKIQNGNLRPAS